MSDGEGGGAAKTVTALQDTIKWVGSIIEKGKPNSSLPSQMANAVPKNDDWQALTGAQGPKIIAAKYQIPGAIYGYNIDVLMHLKFDYGARYHGGGAFITNCWVDVPQCDVMWGFDFNCSFSAQNPENAQDEKSPLARLPVTLKANSSTVLANYTREWSYILYGDGRYEQTQ
jgi:hypothetical protein